MKRLFSSFIIIIMLIGMLPAIAFPAAAASAAKVAQYSRDLLRAEENQTTLFIFGNAYTFPVTTMLDHAFEAGLHQQKNLRIFIIDISSNSKDMLSSVAAQYKSANITFCYDFSGDAKILMKSYRQMADIAGDHYLPITVFRQDSDKLTFKIIAGVPDPDSLALYAKGEDPVDQMMTLKIPGQFYYDYAYECLEYVNELRVSLGLNPVKMDSKYLDIAMQRAAEVSIFYSHERPNGEGPHTAYTDVFTYQGENIAINFSSPKSAFEGWKNSPGHYSTMINPIATSVGIGCFKNTNGTFCWSQCFSNEHPMYFTEATKTGTETVEPTVIAQREKMILNFTFSKDPHTLSKNKTTQIQVVNRNQTFATQQNLNASSFTFSSSNKSVMTVSSSGLCTIKGNGTTTITVSSKEIPSIKLKATVTIGHTYTNSCDTDCNACFQKRTIKHAYSNACDKTCNVCKATRSIKHTYSNSCDRSCNVCKATRSISHTYKKVITKATLTKNGKISHKCSVCGYVASKVTTISKIKSAKLSGTTYTYNGKAKTPSVTVKDAAGKVLKKGTDYVVTYSSGRKKVGTYKVKITFKGNYSGTKTLTFKINPAKTTVSKLTAGKKSITVAITKKSTQVTGYQIQYSTSKKFTNAKTKTISSYKTTKYTLKSLSAKKTYYVRVRTYKTVGKTKYYSGWSTYKYVKTK